MFELFKRLNRYRNNKFKQTKQYIQRLQLNRQKKNRSSFEPKNYRSVLIVMCDFGIGDVIIHSFLIHELRKHNYEVSVVIDEKNKFLFDYFIEIDHIFVFDKRNIKKFIKSDKKITIDLAIDLYDESQNSLRRAKLISSFNPLHTIGFNQKKFFQYDTSINYKEYDSHITKRCCITLNLLEIKFTNVNYYLNLKESDLQKARLFINEICIEKNKFIIIFNPYGSVETKSFSQEQINIIINFLSQLKNCITIIVGEQKCISNIKELPNVFINRNPSFFVTCALVSLSDYVITVDTSIVHVASAYNIPMLAIYSNQYCSFFDLNKVWAPINSNFEQIFVSENGKKIKQATIAKLDVNQLLNKISSLPAS